MNKHTSISGDRPRRRGCLGGCLIPLLIIVLILGVAAVFLFKLPQRYGLVPNAADRLLQSTPDRGAARALLDAAGTRGLNTRGVTLYVLPYKTGDDSVAVAILDTQAGFSFGRGGDSIPKTFVRLAGGPRAAELGVARLTLVYISGRGEELMTMSAPRSAIVEYANARIDEKAFRASVDGELNVPAIVSEQMESVRRLMELK